MASGIDEGLSSDVGGERGGGGGRGDEGGAAQQQVGWSGATKEEGRKAGEGGLSTGRGEGEEAGGAEATNKLCASPWSHH